MNGPVARAFTNASIPVAELWQRMGGLPSPLEGVDIWRDIWFEEAHHSCY
jgi:hypothetical protein